MQPLDLGGGQVKIFAERGAGSGKQKILRQFDKVDVWNGDRLLSAEITQHAIADCRGIVGMIEKQRVEILVRTSCGFS